jgi:hypothetical protein
VGEGPGIDVLIEAMAIAAGRCATGGARADALAAE